MFRGTGYSPSLAPPIWQDNCCQQELLCRRRRHETGTSSCWRQTGDTAGVHNRSRSRCRRRSQHLFYRLAFYLDVGETIRGKKTDATSCAEKDDDAEKEKIANLCFVVSALQGRRDRGKGEGRQQGVRRVAAVALCAGVIYF